MADIRKIVTGDILTDSFAAGIARTYNVKNSKVVTLPSGQTCALADVSELDPTHYVDPLTSSTFHFDHLSLTSTASDVKLAVDASKETTKAVLQTALSKYLETYFISDPSAASVYVKDDKFVLVLTGEKTNLKNFWSGRWNSSWTLSISGSKASLEGTIKVYVHYFEDGNLQLVTSYAHGPFELSFSSDALLASQVVEKIKEQENAAQTKLDEMYNDMNNETFKAMRRVMPVTRTKMDWNINAVRMVRQVRK